MQTTFNASDSGQAVIQNTTAAGIEKLVVNLHPGNDSMVDLQIREEGPDATQLVSSTISIHQEGLQKLVEWLRNQGAVD
ncbi:MAG TPA: hypothetical protein VEC01_15625 [Noviherbaspirillum sp.]|uniref:hypothetical protein n=1 Tax=Noviherbaspirillum sp. TaxID=1926288 RepID=UPI002D3BD157|nr:hypothetical protein [Noviherbaspirillum sp.]HYD96758.1 hypothetical protein [Noviherbaspirillum sp.]